MLVAAAAPVVLVALWLIAWAVDTSGDEGRVPRNTELAGEPIGGLREPEVAAVVAEAAERYPETSLVVETPEGAVDLDGSEVGLALDQEATVDAAMALVPRESVLRRPFTWLGSFFSERRADVVVSVDGTLLADVLPERDPTDRQPPTEPSITGAEGEVRVVPGEPGRGLDATAVAEAVPDAAADGEVPVVVEAEPTTLPPSIDEEAAAALAEEARNRTSSPLPVRVGGDDAEVPVEVLRGWVGSTVEDGELALTWDRGRALEDLRARFGDLGDPPVDARFEVAGGSVRVVPSEPGATCCAESAGDLVAEALAERPADGAPVELPTEERPAELTTDDARGLGIREQIGSFTTNYTPGQSRVQNIQRMAQLVRGAVVRPGERFSINDHVGQRTRAKGFTDGGAIADGELVSTVGGGVSQFATTMFNAAFFAGLDIPEYQMHSIYFDRYPYGREATLSYPQIDLVIANNTGHGILLWPTYTDASITVTIYGTRTFAAEQTGQREEPAGPCTRVVTQRTRTRLATGESSTDSFTARYRPAEGVQC